MLSLEHYKELEKSLWKYYIELFLLAFWKGGEKGKLNAVAVLVFKCLAATRVIQIWVACTATWGHCVIWSWGDTEGHV